MSVRRLLAVRDVRIYLTGQVFSLFGDSAMWLAMGIWVKTLTKSNGSAGLVFFFFTAPTLLAPISGLLVDRVRRRLLLIATNVFAGCAVLLLLLVNGSGQVWLVYLVMTLYGLAYSVLGSAQSALLKNIVPADLLPDANGALRTVQEMLRLVGPLVGSGLFVLVGGHIISIIDAATFLVPVISLLALRPGEPKPSPRDHRWRAELGAGILHIHRTPALRQAVTVSACALFVFGFSETTIFAIAANGLHEPPSFVGVLIAVQGAGAVIGGPTAAPLVRRLGEGRAIGAGLLCAAAGAALEIPPFMPSVIVGVILFGMSIPWVVVGFMTLLQRATPASLQGRVYSAADTLVTTPQTISIAIGAALIGICGYRVLLSVMAATIMSAAVYMVTRSRPQADSVPAETPG